MTLTFIRTGRHPVKSKLTLSARAGANRIGFQGRLSKKRRLAPGSYKVLIQAAGGNTGALHFTIVR